MPWLLLIPVAVIGYWFYKNSSAGSTGATYQPPSSGWTPVNPLTSAYNPYAQSQNPNFSTPIVTASTDPGTAAQIIQMTVASLLAQIPITSPAQTLLGTNPYQRLINELSNLGANPTYDNLVSTTNGMSMYSDPVVQNATAVLQSITG